MIYHWEKSRSIPKRAKIVALTSIFIATLWSCYILPALWLKVLVVVLVTWPVVFLWRLPLSDGNAEIVSIALPTENNPNKD